MCSNSFPQNTMEKPYLRRPGCWCDSKWCYHHETLGVTILIPVSWLHCPSVQRAYHPTALGSLFIQGMLLSAYHS